VSIAQPYDGQFCHGALDLQVRYWPFLTRRDLAMSDLSVVARATCPRLGPYQPGQVDRPYLLAVTYERAIGISGTEVERDVPAAFNTHKRDIVSYFAEAKDDRAPHGQLTVFGDADGLRQLLDSWKVDYKDLHRALPLVVEPGVVAVGQSDHQPDPLVAPQLSAGASLLWFYPDDQKRPGVYQKVTAHGLASTTNFVPPADWGQSPFFQRLLLELIQQAILLNPPHEN